MGKLHRDYLGLLSEQKILINLDSTLYTNSYNTFKHIDNVKYVPDLVFGLGIRKGRKIKNSVGVSLVDLSLPVRGEKVNKIDSKYCKMLKNNIEKFIDEGKEVYLFSFCEHEGDLRTIDRILDLMDDSYSSRVNIIDYTGKSGDLYYFVKLYSRMEKTICTRFHSLVMSLVFKQELMVVSYSDKLNNLLDDLGYDFDVVNIDNKIGKLVINDSDFKVIDDMTLNKFKKEAIIWYCSNVLKHPIPKRVLRDGNFDKETKDVLYKAAEWFESQKDNHNITIIPLEQYTARTVIKLIKKYTKMNCDVICLDVCPTSLVGYVTKKEDCDKHFVYNEKYI